MPNFKVEEVQTPTESPQDGFMQDYFNNHLSVTSTSSSAKIFRRDKQYSKRMKRRLVYKNGECNISQTNIKKMKRRYLADIFTTLIDMKWRYTLTTFVMGFVLSWLMFAVIWWIIAFSHGDIEHLGEEDWKECVVGVNNFATALLFSIETQHTIGYGSRSTTEYCPEAIVIMMLQSCFGVIVQALMTGLVFAKISRPKKRAETLMFSKNAVICKRDSKLCLMFRVGDMRKSQIVEAHIRVMMIKKVVTKEGEILPLEQQELNVGFDNGTDRLFLVWPTMIVHIIDEHSPFWEMSATDLYRESFEVVSILEGVVESTGMTTQARSSYLPSEILWGHRLERLITFQKEDGAYKVDYSRFNSTMPVDTPMCSAMKLEEQGDPDGESQQSYEDTSSEDLPRTRSSCGCTGAYTIKRNGEVQTSQDRTETPTCTASALSDTLAVKIE